jgi:uncharacterized membrane protein HdeD (DUF308 family)
MAMRSWAGRLAAEETRFWWLLLVSGAAWILLSLAILQFNLTSVWSIAILTGIVLFAAALTEFAVAAITPSWTWARVLLGVAFIIGGVVAFAWPKETFLVLADLIGWYLLFLGTFEVVESLSSRRTELWWLRLIVGAATIAIAFWAVHSLERSVTLLILWVGIGALIRGLNQIFLAFEFRAVHERAASIGTSSSAGRSYDIREERPTTPAPS